MALPPATPRWILGEAMTTVWPMATEAHRRHGDFIEHGGLRTGVSNYAWAQ